MVSFDSGSEDTESKEVGQEKIRAMNEIVKFLEKDNITSI